MDVTQHLSADHCDVIKVGSYSVANVYKPPSETWNITSPLPTLPHPAIYVGDFNSHHPHWGYDSADAEGENLLEWSSHNNLSLVNDPKQHGTFKSACWQREYSPDLCCVSSVNGQALPANNSPYRPYTANHIWQWKK